MAQYKLCNWCVSSDFELPELSPWQGGLQAPDITIRHGTIAIDSTPSRKSYTHIVMPHGNLLQVEDVARYWITGGNDILIEPYPAAEPAAVRLFLLGTVFGLLCHQRGLIPLHASCVSVEGNAVAFAGPSGIGKSTLAAAFACRGYSVVSDDICVIDTLASGGPKVLPFAPRLKLIKDSLSAVGFLLEHAEVMEFESEKLDVISGVRIHSEPLPLAAIYHLGITVKTAGERIKLEQGAGALAMLNDNIYRVKAARKMGKQGALFDASVRIARQVSNYSLMRTNNFSDLDDFIQCLLSQRAA